MKVNFVVIPKKLRSLLYYFSLPYLKLYFLNTNLTFFIVLKSFVVFSKTILRTRFYCLLHLALKLVPFYLYYSQSHLLLHYYLFLKNETNQNQTMNWAVFRCSNTLLKSFQKNCVFHIHSYNLLQFTFYLIPLTLFFSASESSFKRKRPLRSLYFDILAAFTSICSALAPTYHNFQLKWMSNFTWFLLTINFEK